MYSSPAPELIFDTDPTHGPLFKLVPVFVDFEMYMDKETRLGVMTLRQYLTNSYVTAVSVAIGTDEPVVVENTGDEYEGVIGLLRDLAARDDVVIVAHNAAFDVRVMRFKCDIPQPKNVWCTLESSMCAWPENPHGHSLRGLSMRSGFKKPKLALDLSSLAKYRKTAEKAGYVYLNAVSETFRTELTGVFAAVGLKPNPKLTTDDLDAALLIYNKRDVEALQEVFYAQRSRIPPVEQMIGLLTNNTRRFHFCVDEERRTNLVTKLNVAAERAEKLAVAVLSRGGNGTLEGVFDEDTELPEDETRDAEIARKNIFNHGEDGLGDLASIRYARLKKVIHAKFNATDLESTSLKKLSPVKLAKYPSVHEMLKHSSRAGKMVYHRRKAQMFHGVSEVDVELGFFRSHTGRFSSPGAGGARGLNLHNVPKHDKEVAQPIRELFRVPDDMCLVRADFANVELRVEGILTGCKSIIRMFDVENGGDPLVDPYVAGWRNMTRIQIDKNTEKGKNMRQLSKAAHLALGFCQSPAGFTATSLLKAIAQGDTNEVALGEIIRELGWYPPKYGVSDIIEKTGCSYTVALAAFHIHRAFNEAHPEFRLCADWLYRCVEAVSSMPTAGAANRRLDAMRESATAPDPSMLYLFAEQESGEQWPSIRAKCGPWVPTVCWREPHGRRFGPVGTSDMRLSIRKANGLFKVFTKQLAIENVTQAAARNQLCWGLIQLEQAGFPHVFHVHDEIMILVPKQRTAVLAAKQALIDIFGPTAPGKPLKWATVLKPSEISVTQSLWEDENDLVEFFTDKKTKEKIPGGNRWHRIEQNLAGCLDNLP